MRGFAPDPATRPYTAPMPRAAFVPLLACLCAFAAQAVPRESWTFDPQVLMARSEAVITRAPDASLDRLFQAVTGAARRPAELQAMCALFDPAAARDLAAINRTALAFGDDSRRAFQQATDALLAASDDAPVQPYDPELAARALRQSAIATAMLYDGFVVAVNSPRSDPASQRARCRALRQLLDTVSMRPLPERAMITRLLMREGLRRVER